MPMNEGKYCDWDENLADVLIVALEQRKLIVAASCRLYHFELRILKVYRIAVHSGYIQYTYTK